MNLLILSLLLVSQSSFANIGTFSEAKRVLNNMYEKTSLKKEEIYCGCSFNKNKIDLSSCPYKGKVKNGKEMFQSRSTRLEWEHLFPVSLAVGAFSECRKPGGKNMSRKDCLGVSRGFRELEANIYNLYPSVGSINAARSNLSYAALPTGKKEWGQCDFKSEGNKVEPSNKVKGDIARVYKYLHQKYPQVGVISNKNEKLFDAWDKMDPVDAEECKLNKLKAQYQDDQNLFVMKHCK